MRKVIFEGVEAENFCNFEEMSYPIDGQGLTSISGPNGIGKTTCLDVIPFALYGVTSKGLRGEDVINNKVGRNCKVSLKFKVDDEDYEVIRYVKYSRFGSTVHLKKGEEIIKKGQNEVKPTIEKLLIPQKLFFNTLLFGQKVKTFFTQLTDAEQKIIFRNILSLEKYEDYKKEVGERIKKYEGNLTKYDNDLKVNSSILENIESEIINLIESQKSFEDKKKEKIIYLKNELKEIEDEINKLEENLNPESDLESDYEDIKDQIIKTEQDVERTLTSIENIVVDITNKADHKKSELESRAKDVRHGIEEDLNELTSELKDKFHEADQKYLHEIKNLEKEIEVFDIRTKTLISSLDNLLKEKEEIQNVLKDEDATCPTCKQKIKDEETINNFKEILKEKDKKIISIGEEIESIKAESGRFEIEHVRGKTSYEKIKKSFNDNIKQVEDGRDEKTSEVNKKLEVALQKVKDLVGKELSEKTSKLEVEKESILEKVRDLKLSKHEFEYKLREKTNIDKLISHCKNKKEIELEKLKLIEKMIFDPSEIDNKKIKRKSLRSKVSSLNENISTTKEDLEILEFWKVAFSSAGIPSMLIDEAIPFMNRRVSHYLDKLSAGRYTVSFDTMKEIGTGEFRDKININVVDNLTKANTRDQLSGGQTRLVDIASILTLYDLQSFVQDIIFNMMIFDEIFDSLDDENIRYVSNVLKELVGEEKSIFLITHRHIDQLEVDNELNFWN